jgi:hypothetical protein
MFRSRFTAPAVAMAAVVAVLLVAALAPTVLAQASPKICPGGTRSGSTQTDPFLAGGDAGKFLKSYFEMRILLYKNKMENLGSLSKELVAETKNFRGKVKRAKGPSGQIEALRKIENAAGSFKPKDLERARKEFKELSSRVFKYVQAFGYDEPVYAYYCDMAKAAWLQETREAGNPYYGPKMPKCGVLVGWVANGEYQSAEAVPVQLKTM